MDDPIRHPNPYTPLGPLLVRYPHPLMMIWRLCCGPRLPKDQPVLDLAYLPPACLATATAGGGGSNSKI